MNSHIVLGLGGGVDYELKLDSAVLEHLVGEYQIHNAELTSSATVATERELVISILTYLRKGGEASTSSPPPTP